MFLSVIIPNFNHSLFIEQRIDSVINQNFDNYEIIILDDKSTDASREIIEKYRSNKYVSHIVFNENNSGNTFLQWEKGFQLAKGEYIWIAESDDFAHPQFLSTLVPLLVKWPKASMAFCTSLFVDENGKSLNWNNDIESKRYKVYKSNDFISKRMVLGNAVNNASSAIFKKEYLSNLDDSYKQYKAAGDWLFWIMIAEKGPVIEVKQRLNYFRQHTNKVSPKSKASGISFFEMKQIYLVLKEEGYIRGFKKYLAIGQRLFVIHKFNSYESKDIQNNVKLLYSVETKFPLFNRYSYLLWRSIEILFNKIYGAFI